jgi:hypothetical protein
VKPNFSFFGFSSKQPYTQSSDYYKDLDNFITDYNNMCIKRFYSRLCEEGFGRIQYRFGDM